jgi:hypothetical protein
VYSCTTPSLWIAHTALASQYVFLLSESCFRQCTVGMQKTVGRLTTHDKQKLGSATSSNRERMHMIKGTEWGERRSYKKKETIQNDTSAGKQISTLVLTREERTEGGGRSSMRLA